MSSRLWFGWSTRLHFLSFINLDKCKQKNTYQNTTNLKKIVTKIPKKRASGECAARLVAHQSFEVLISLRVCRKPSYYMCCSIYFIMYYTQIHIMPLRAQACCIFVFLKHAKETCNLQDVLHAKAACYPIYRKGRVRSSY